MEFKISEENENILEFKIRNLKFQEKWEYFGIGHLEIVLPVLQMAMGQQFLK